jgi:flavin reductase (DIM6/NTAB) family NADH-FMN oxidoreductase RutF
MTVNPAEHDPRDVYKLLIGSVVPRPIALVSTVSAGGVRNLAPFSFFNAICPNPPMVCFSPTFKASPNGEPGRKDTLRNVQETGEFVVNIVSEDFAEAMNATSGEYPPEIDEFLVSGLTPAPSDIVRPPRVKESKVQMECRLVQVVTVSQRPLGASLVIGEVLRFHVDDSIVDNFRIDPNKLRAIGRMGGTSYARTSDRFELARPVVK